MIGLLKMPLSSCQSNTKRPSGNLLSPLTAQNKDLGAASQTLPTKVKLRLRGRLVNTIYKKKNNTRLSYGSASKLYPLSVMFWLPFVREVRVLFSPVSMALLRAVLDKIATVTSSTRYFNVLNAINRFLERCYLSRCMNLPYDQFLSVIISKIDFTLVIWFLLCAKPK